MNAKEEIAELGKLLALDRGETRKEVLFCFDLAMTATKAEKDLSKLFKALANRRLKIVKTDCGLDLIYKDELVRNRMRNKIKVTVERASRGEKEVHPRILREFYEFLSPKIVAESA